MGEFGTVLIRAFSISSNSHGEAAAAFHGSHVKRSWGGAHADIQEDKGTHIMRGHQPNVGFTLCGFHMLRGNIVHADIHSYVPLITCKVYVTPSNVLCAFVCFYKLRTEILKTFYVILVILTWVKQREL